MLPARVSSASDEARAARSAARKAAAGGAPPAKRQATVTGVERTARKLQWQLGPEVLSAMRYAEANVSDLISQNEVKVRWNSSCSSWRLLQSVL